MDTRPTLLREYGPPPWDLLAGQRSCKYASPRCAESIAHPWIKDLIAAMRETLPSTSLLVDIRFWEHLEPGDSPGLPHWHFDCFNAAGDPRSEGETHRLYFYGAGCRTLFRAGDFRPPEGWIVAYDHDHEHRVMPATLAGPRLLVRVSHATIQPANVIKPPPLFRARRG